jgi:hypothetical protein
MESRNKFVACTPFERRSVQLEVRSGVASAKQKVELTPLTVVFDFQPEKDQRPLLAGWRVFVRGDEMLSQYAKEEYTIDGMTFILVPYDQIRLVDEWNE